MASALPGPVPSIDELYYVDIRTQSRQQRSELLDKVESMIVQLEYYQQRYKPATIAWFYVAQKLLAMRAKRFALVLSFDPKFNGRIHVGVHE